MKRLIIICLVGTIIFSLCSCNQVEDNTIGSSASVVTEPITDTTKEEKATETTVESTTEQTTAETTKHNPILTLNQMEFDGILPDGEYAGDISSFDEDSSGAVFNVSGYWCLTEEEANNSQEGDTIVMGSIEFKVTDCNLSSSYFEISNGTSGTQKQRNGLYYFRGEADEVRTYKIVDEYHIPFAANIEVYSDVNIYGQEDITWDESDKRYCSPFKYNNTQEFIRDVTENGGLWYGCHIVIENGVVTKIYVNPELHNPWMSQKIWKKYHS